MKKFLVLSVFSLLSACQPAPNGYSPDPITFNKPPLRIDVAEIKVIENYRAPLRAPNVEHDFPVPPAVAVKQWANQRLIAAGQAGVLEVVIENAAVKEVPLPKTKGVKGIFTDDQDARYDATLKVTFQLYSGAQALSDASGDVSITRSRSINEKATVDDRERMFHTMTKEIMQTFDSEAETRLRTYFTRFLR